MCLKCYFSLVAEAGLFAYGNDGYGTPIHPAILTCICTA